MRIHRVGPETERLRHRAVELRDAEAFLRLKNDPEIVRYTCDDLRDFLGSPGCSHRFVDDGVQPR